LSGTFLKNQNVPLVPLVDFGGETGLLMGWRQAAGFAQK
jgi:hypothetical protein